MEVYTITPQDFIEGKPYDNKKPMDKQPTRPNLPTFEVVTEYNTGLKTSNEVQCSKGIDAPFKAIAKDRKVHGDAKIDRCKSAIHTIFVDGEEMDDQVETILRNS